MQNLSQATHAILALLYHRNRRAELIKTATVLLLPAHCHFLTVESQYQENYILLPSQCYSGVVHDGHTGKFFAFPKSENID